MSSKVEAHLRDILENAQIIREYLTDQSLADYQSNRMMRDAIERRLQNLTEAAFRLKENASILCPSVDWRDVRGLGNFLRHEYDKVGDQHIWDKLQERLPEIVSAVTTALAQLQAAELEEQC